MTNTAEQQLGYGAGEVHALLGVVMALSYQVPERSKFKKEIENLEQHMRANVEAMPFVEGYVMGIENVFSQLKQALNKATQ